MRDGDLNLADTQQMYGLDKEVSLTQTGEANLALVMQGGVGDSATVSQMG